MNDQTDEYANIGPFRLSKRKPLNKWHKANKIKQKKARMPLGMVKQNRTGREK